MTELAGLIALLALLAAWAGVRRLQDEAPAKPCVLACEGSQYLAALDNHVHTLGEQVREMRTVSRCAVDRAAQATRRQPEPPLPGTQQKRPAAKRKRT